MTRSNGRWSSTRIGDALRLVNGRAFKPIEWKKTGLPIVRIQNLNNPDAPFNYYDGELPEKFLLDDGDLLFAWSGTPGTSFGAHIWRGGKAWLNQHIFKVHFDEKEFDKRYLQLAINRNLQEYIQAAHGGAGLAHITKGRFEESTLPCPSLGEQQRIVAEIEKQFTRLEAGVASLQRVQAELKRYRASVLKAACEGDWETTTLGALSRESSYGTSVKCGYQSFGVPVLRIPNIQKGRIELGDLKFATRAIDADPEDYLRPNDFLVVRTNGSKDLIGRGAAVLTEFAQPHFFASYLIRFRLRDGDAAKWLSILWDSEDVRKQILRIAATSAGQYNVNQTNLSKISIPFPPLENRIRILAEVERRLSVIANLKTATSAQVGRAVRFRHSLLKRAFSTENETSD